MFLILFHFTFLTYNVGLGGYYFFQQILNILQIIY